MNIEILLKILYFSIRHQSHPQFLGSDNKNQVQDMYDRDTNNNENYLLTDNNNYFYPKSTSLLTKDDWMWKEKRPLGSHTKISPLNAEGDPLKYSSNNYNEVNGEEILSILCFEISIC